MIIQMKRSNSWTEHPAYVLPDEFGGLQVMTLDGRHHLAHDHPLDHADPPLCGASTASGNFARASHVSMAELPICSHCVFDARG